ncbi:MAG: formyltransferase family protein [Bdellovibrionota bacterium]
MIKWGILISGRGSNLQTAMDWDDRVLIDTVCSNKIAAPGLGKAKRSGRIFLAHSAAPTNWAALQNLLVARGIQKIFLLGFMKLIPESFVDFWTGKMFNVHPSLLPKHAGLHGLEKGWESGDQLGVTVHHVTFEMDAGSPVHQGTYSRLSTNFKKIVRRNAWMERRLISEVLCR